MEEKINKNKKRNSKDKINQKAKKNTQCEKKKKYICQNPLSLSKNNDSTKDTLQLMKYNKPFKNNNTKNNDKNDIFDKEYFTKNKDSANKNKQNKNNQIKDVKKQNNNKINKLLENNEKISGDGNYYANKYLMKEDEETVTSFERKPSEIQSPNTVSEDSFITEVSNYSHNKLNKKNNNNNYNDKGDIVNYNNTHINNKYHNDSNKGKNKQNCIKIKKEEKGVFNKSKELNKNENTERNILYNNKMQSCKKILPEKYYKDKINLLKRNDLNTKNLKKEIYNKNKANKNIDNDELINNPMYLINEYNLKKNEIKKDKLHLYNDDKEMHINTRKNDYDFDNTNYLNSTVNKNSTKVQFDLDLDKKNIGLNNSNIYIPVNQRKKLESNKKNNFNDSSVDSPKNTNKKNNNKKNHLCNSTELNSTKKLSILIKKKNDNTDKKNSENQKKSKFNPMDIIPKNILSDLNDEENNENKNDEKIYNKNTNNNLNNNAVARNSCVNKNSNNCTTLTKNATFVKRKSEKLNLTNVNFYKNKNNKNNNVNKKNNKLFLSIDDLNEIQKPTVLYTKMNENNPIIYAPKKPSLLKYKGKKKKEFLYNRASYDPNQSNYNNMRKKNFIKEQTITTANLNNNNNYNKRHTRNYSGISNSTFIEMKNPEYIPNKLTSINSYILNNNSHGFERNSINMKIINSLNRSYDSSFYPNLNKLYYNNNRNNLVLNNRNIINNHLNSINTKTPNKYSLKTDNFFNENIKENDKKKFNIYANNINNINNFLDIENPILKYNVQTNKNYNNNLNIINSNNNNNNKERLTFGPQQKRINFDFFNQCNRFNNVNIQNYQNQSNLINLYTNNNLYEDNNFSNCVNYNSRGNNYGIDFNLNLFNYLNNQQRITPLSINIDDLILLLEKFNNIIANFNNINNKRIVYKECFEFWNYYFNCSLYCQLEKLFLNNLDSNAVRISINYCLMSIMILYDYSFEIKCLKNDYNAINNILKLNYMNLMLISEHILKMITSSKSQINNNNNSNVYNNFLILKLYNIIDVFRRKGGFQNDFIEIKPFITVNDLDISNVEKISYNTNLIIQYLRYALKNNKTTRNDILTGFFKKIKEKTYEEINIFFHENIFRIINKNGSLSSLFMNNKQMNNFNNNNIFNKNNFKNIPAPYIRTKNNKNYSLVLDLDETLIHFKPGTNNEEGVVRIRPGVTEFLEEIGKFYELIIFTTGTQEYADLLIDAVEEDKIYFDHRLYREHATKIDNDIVKDLTKIGRPMDKIIIIDDNPKCLRLQKENGIVIKPFLGEDNYDKVLFSLIPILKNIAKEGGDLRIGLIKYKNKILNATSVRNN